MHYMSNTTVRARPDSLAYDDICTLTNKQCHSPKYATCGPCHTYQSLNTKDELMTLDMKGCIMGINVKLTSAQAETLVQIVKEAETRTLKASRKQKSAIAKNALSGAAYEIRSIGNAIANSIPSDCTECAYYIDDDDHGMRCASSITNDMQGKTGPAQ